MKVIIDIPEDVYVARKYGDISPWITGTILDAVEQGTPLPKGHGRLIDADKLCQTPIDSTDLPCGKCLMVYDVDEIADAPTVVDADKGE